MAAHSWEQRKAQFLSRELMSATRRFEGCLVVLPSLSRPVPLSRAWCLWELYCAAASGLAVHLLVAEGPGSAAYREPEALLLIGPESVGGLGRGREQQQEPETSLGAVRPRGCSSKIRRYCARDGRGARARHARAPRRRRERVAGGPDRISFGSVNAGSSASSIVGLDGKSTLSFKDAVGHTDCDVMDNEAGDKTLLELTTGIYSGPEGTRNAWAAPSYGPKAGGSRGRSGAN